MKMINDILYVIQEIYYAGWASIATWEFHARVIFVIFILFFVIKIAVWLLQRILSIILKNLIIPLIYWVYRMMEELIIFLLHNKSNEERIVQMNREAVKFGKLSEKADILAKKLKKGKGGSIWKYFIIYVLTIIIVMMPDILEEHISKEYLKYFSWGKNVYCSLEKKPLKKALKYDPLFAEKEKKEKTWYGLSEKGVYGSHIRNGPGKEYESIEIISGNEKFQYIGETEKWMHIKLQNGIEGWISKSLVKKIEKN